MKVLIFLVAMTFAFASNAASNLYAKVDGKAIKCTAQNDYGVTSSDECSSYEFITGSFCFTGSRTELIAAISADLFNFDEEWVADANYYGQDLSFVVYDGPNELSEKIIASKCTKSFFEN